MGISSVNSNTEDYSASYVASVSASQQLVSDIKENTDTTGLTLAAIGGGAVKISGIDATVLETAIHALDKSYAVTMNADGLSAIITRVPVGDVAATDTTDSVAASYYTDKVPDYGATTDLSSLLSSATAATTDKTKLQQLLEQIMAMLMAMLNKQPPSPAATAETTTVVDSTQETASI
jgi:hypothetical protein